MLNTNGFPLTALLHYFCHWLAIRALWFTRPAGLITSAIVASVVAQELPLVTILGPTGYAIQFVGDHWIQYSVPEMSLQMDVNGDGDTDDWILHVRDLASGETVNLDVPDYGALVVGDQIVFAILESQQANDLNNDGDAADGVIHVYDPSSRRLRSLGLAGSATNSFGDMVDLRISEAEQGQDLNGDGDTEDWIDHVYDASTGRLINLRLDSRILSVSRPVLVLSVFEGTEGRDLNGDGDIEDQVCHLYDLATGVATNLRLVCNIDSACVAGNELLLTVSESAQGEDLNGDGDTRDTVVHFIDLSSGQVMNSRLVAGSLGVAACRGGKWIVFRASESGSFHLHDVGTGVTTNLGADEVRTNEDWLVYSVPEPFAGHDLNGDGDVEDQVVHVRYFSSGEAVNLQLAEDPYTPGEFDRFGDWVPIPVIERGQGADLSSDGDTDDSVVHFYRLSTGVTTNSGMRSENTGREDSHKFWGIAGERAVFSITVGCEQHVRLFDLPSSEVTDIGPPYGSPFPWFGDRWLVLVACGGISAPVYLYDLQRHVNVDLGLRTRTGSFGVGAWQSVDWMLLAATELDSGKDWNGDGDSEDDLWVVVDLFRLGHGPPFHRADPNSSGTTDLSDAIAIFSYLFLGRAAPSCLESADVNNDATIDISDGIGILNWVFNGGPVPAPPGAAPASCGEDPDPLGSEGDLGCASYGACL